MNYTHAHSQSTIPAVLLLLVISILTACGSSPDRQGTAESLQPVPAHQAVDIPENANSAGNQLPALPQDGGPTEPARELSYTNVVHYGGDGIFDSSPGNLFPAGSTVVASDDTEFGWVTYAFNTGGYQPEQLSLDITCNPGSSAYIAYSDYGSGRWAFQQPVTGPAGFELPPGIYLNSFNQFYVAVVTYGGSLATVNSISIEFDNDLVYDHGISGTILDEHGEPLAGHFLFINPNPDNVQVLTDVNGDYTIGLPTAGMYDVTPQSMNTVYNPVMETVDVNGMMTGVDFTGTRLDISGRIVNSEGIGLPGVALTLNPGGAMTTSGADGEYSFTVLTDDSYTVEPLLATYSFSPMVGNANVSGADVENLDFDYSGGQPTYGIFGNVHESDLTPVAGVYVSLNPGNRLTITDANGNYGFTGLAESTYDLACQKTGWGFAPPVKQVNISGSSENNADFTGTPPLPTRMVSGKLEWEDPENSSQKFGIPDLLVKLEGINGNSAGFSTYTDDSGDYVFPAVSQGMYLLKTSSFSYEEKVSGITVADINVNYSSTVKLRTGGPTWQNFAASYIGNSCTSCHRPDSQTSVSPFLRNYDEVVDTGSSNNARIQNDTMPPGNPSLAIHKRQFQLWRLANYPLDDYTP